MEKKIHHGKNVARFRQMLGMKQDLLASLLGEEWTQLKISRLEAKEEIEDGILDDVARALKIPVDAIKNFDEEAVISIVANIVNNNDNATGNSLFSYYPTFNPVDKIVELFERLVASEKEKVNLMKEILEKMNK
ncbi:MAG: helix-turn-helix transcriptional regulator [Flavihumibacter sp.]|nr:helix-turn-helix transcriptional regulator [Flavihumibacter sp.]